jgi:hypothetical protein
MCTLSIHEPPRRKTYQWYKTKPISLEFENRRLQGLIAERDSKIEALNAQVHRLGKVKEAHSYYDHLVVLSR